MTNSERPAIPRHVKKLLDAGEIIRTEQPGEQERGYVAKQLVHATLPHSPPKNNAPVWSRINGNYTLIVRAGYKTDPVTREVVCLGIPSGSIPRLAMYWITKEAIITQSPVLTLGSMSQFMRDLGLNPGNGGSGSRRSDAYRLRTQLERLMRATISFEYTGADSQKWVDMQVASEGELWWSHKSPEQGSIFESKIVLGEKFYTAIMDGPVPLNMVALRALKSSPMALDVYAWSSLKTFSVNRHGKPQRVTWRQLMQQFGSGYSDFRNFKRGFKQALTDVYAVSPGLKIDTIEGGVMISPGRTAIASKPTLLF